MTHADAHAHDHPPFLRHHFDTPKQQFEAGKLGMWMFLATEVLLFGGLFVGYSIWRGLHPELFKYGSQFLDTTLGATNTVVLIVSSLTMATAVTMAQLGRRGPLVLMLVLTLAGAVTFLVIKYFEYTSKFEHGLYPGLKMYQVALSHGPPETFGGPLTSPPDAAPAPAPAVPPGMPPGTEPSTIPMPASGPAGIDEAVLAEHHGGIRHKEHAGGEHVHPVFDRVSPNNVHMFFNIYFLMTGLHGIHVAIGIIMLTWLLVGALKGRFSPQYFTPVDLGGLYWHIVDLIWIFLFPLFYLI